MLLPKVDCFTSITYLADDSHVGFARDERNQTFADHAVIVSDENSDARFLLLSRFRRFLRCRPGFFGGLRRYLLFRCHEIDSPLHGKSTVILVPFPRELAISNS